MNTIFNVVPDIPDDAKLVSYSQFSLYNSCPHKWKLQYIDKIRIDEPSIHLIFGTAMHETLQEYLRVVFEVSAIAGDKLNLNDILKQNLTKEYLKIKDKNLISNTVTRLQLEEVYSDGIEIVDWFRKHRREYFPSKNHKLLGIEIPILCKVLDGYNVYIKGFIDIVILDESDNTIIIYDFKTSTRGWKDKDKKDESKKSQLILYKEFFSKQFDIPYDNIHIEFLILKRKIFEGGDFTPKRIQRFVPPSGKLSRKKVLTRFHEFITNCFNTDGSYRTDVVHAATQGEANINCKYCIFKSNEKLCDPINRC